MFVVLNSELSISTNYLLLASTIYQEVGYIIYSCISYLAQTPKMMGNMDNGDLPLALTAHVWLNVMGGTNPHPTRLTNQCIRIFMRALRFNNWGLGRRIMKPR